MVSQVTSAVHFGAGNIGRGFIGALLVESGYFVVFADVDTKLIKELNTHDSYEVHVLDEIERTEEVHSYSGVLSQTDEVLHAIAQPHTRLITTAVGPNVLVRIAPIIAKGLQERLAAGDGPLNIIACENMVGQTETLGKYVRLYLSDEENAWLGDAVGFANCSVDRIDFSEWAVDRSGLRTPIEPPVRGMTLTDALPAYIERKLYTLNCGHAIAAYLGFAHGLDRIDQALANTAILQDSGAALVRKHGFDEREHEHYVERALHRFMNPKLHDEVVRVGRQPLRKLAKGDRLLGPTAMAREYGLPVDHLARGIAAAFLFDLKDDPQSVELIGKVDEVGIERAVVEYTGFEEGSDVYGKIVEAYLQLKELKM
ncbi:mannitol dehydrogenase domain-containing protein [Lactarius hatsudake]|nr:mannitol dehydrogenase domain-containing protein [Lactarius hatsudake]